MAMADSKQPVVEKVQQLPQAPCMKNRRGNVPGGAAGSPAPQNPGAALQSLRSLLAAAQPLPRGTAGTGWLGELPWHPALLLGHSTCPQPAAPPGTSDLLTWFFTGVTKFPFFLQSMESGWGPELRRKFPLVAEQFCQ